MTLARWSDDRLDDLSMTVRRMSDRLDDFDRMRVELAELHKDVKAAAGDAHACSTGLAGLKRDLELRAEVQHNERKADRKWMIGTLLATASIVIAALAVFVG